MKLLKPEWVSHDGSPIFSVAIHPDGSRFATGGQGKDSGVVVIWNMAPVRSVTMCCVVPVRILLCMCKSGNNLMQYLCGVVYT